MYSPPILPYADFSKPFILHADASTEGLGAVLYQEQDGLECVIAYASRGLRAGEKHCPAHKLELECIKRKTIPGPSAQLVNITSSQPMELVCIDFLSLERSKGGFENIPVITDHFRRYAQAFQPEIKNPRPLQKFFLTISLFIMASCPLTW